MTPAIAFVALAIERLFGYPKFMQAIMGHPVEWMGALIGWFEKNQNISARPASERRIAGTLMLILVMAISCLIALFVTVLINELPNGWFIEAIIASVFLSQRQLAQTVRNVADGLDISLARGREAVGHIVGRDTKNLDEAEVSRAAIETLAENASDGVIAPLFWLLIFGLPGIVVYKAINTADSMVGHFSNRYTDFGWASAKVDDIVNWIPARITAGFIVLAAIIMPGASGGDAWSAARCDGPKHNSPNAGWPEAAMAGALSFGLGGPRKYDGKTTDLPKMGVGSRDLTSRDIRRALVLFAATGGVAFALTGAIAVLTFIPA